MATGLPTLEETRGQIDAIDRMLVGALAQFIELYAALYAVVDERRGSRELQQWLLGVLADMVFDYTRDAVSKATIEKVTPLLREEGERHARLHACAIGNIRSEEEPLQRLEQHGMALLQLMALRRYCATIAGTTKRLYGLPYIDGQVEEKRINAAVTAGVSYGIHKSFIAAFMRALIDEAREVQQQSERPTVIGLPVHTNGNGRDGLKGGRRRGTRGRRAQV